MAFSGGVKLGDLDDFISLSQDDLFFEDFEATLMLHVGHVAQHVVLCSRCHLCPVAHRRVEAAVPKL